MFKRTGCSVIGQLHHLDMFAHLAKAPAIPVALVLIQSQRLQSTAPSLSKHFAAAPVIGRKNVVTSTKSHAEVLAAQFAANATPVKRPTLPPKMVFRHATSASGQHQMTAAHSTLAWDAGYASEVAFTTYDAATATATRPLVLLFAWMLSKNAHIDKYREFWTKRGYDILTLQTSPFDLLFPKIGGRQNAINVFDYLSAISPRYDEVVVHAFSVGGYQLSEFMHRMSVGCIEGDPRAIKMYESIKGYIVDSCVFADDCAPGLSRAVTRNKIVQPLLEASIANFLKFTKSFTYDRYIKVQNKLFENEMHVPGLLLFSHDDVVSNVQTNYQLAESWSKQNIPTSIKCWSESTHVLHYKEHPEEYEYEVDKFINQISVTKAPKTRPIPPSS